MTPTTNAGRAECERCGKDGAVGSHYGLCCDCIVPFDQEVNEAGTPQEYAKGYHHGYIDGAEAARAEVAAKAPVLRKALTIGAISHDGDGWFAADAGYGYDEAEAAIKEAFAVLAILEAAPKEDAS